MVCEVTPSPLTVIVAVRCDVPVLVAALTVTVPLLEPVAGATVSHVSLLLTIQFIFEVMSKVLFSAVEEKLSEVADTVKVGVSVAPGCVTLMIWEVTPEPLTVIVAVRCVASVLAVALIVTEPLFAPEDGETVNHVGASCAIVQFVLEVILNDCCPASDVKLSEVVDSAKDGKVPSCVTLMVCVITPVPMTVIIAVRCVMSVFSVAVTVSVPLFAPVAGETVSQD